MINKVFLIGRLGSDVKIFSTVNGKMARFSLATSETWKDKDGQKQEKTDWHNIVVTGTLINLMDYIHKGSLVFVTGKLRYREVENSKQADVFASEIQILESKK